MDPLPVPCLALQPQQHSLDAVKTTLFNIKGQDIGCGLDGMTNNSKFWVTPRGWILARDTASMSTFLFNPRNPDEKIQLPHLTEDLRTTCACLLSCKPTLPGCTVLLVEPNATVIWQCCVGGKEWARHEHNVGTQLVDPASDLREKVPMCPIAACRGKFYFKSESFADIGVLEFSPTPVFSSLKLAGECEVHLDTAKVFLVESEEDLYMVGLVDGFGWDLIDLMDYRILVHKMDFSVQQWRRAYDLGGRAFLLASGYFGASCSADEHGLKADCVYMVCPGDTTYLKITSVKDGWIQLMKVPAAIRALCLLPPLIHSLFFLVKEKGVSRFQR
uniref:KIB1-4 beta-propeller domain-containing protein n=1 Tax=Oryza brachyantha TaxID=4533 RepID=J3LZ95_ORYBR